MDCKKVLSHETLGEVSSSQNQKDQSRMVHKESGDSDHLYTPPRSDDDGEGVRYLNYKSGEGVKF